MGQTQVLSPPELVLKCRSCWWTWITMTLTTAWPSFSWPFRCEKPAGACKLQVASAGLELGSKHTLLLDPRTYENQGLTLWRTIQLAQRLTAALPNVDVLPFGYDLALEPLLTHVQARAQRCYCCARAHRKVFEGGAAESTRWPSLIH